MRTHTLLLSAMLCLVFAFQVQAQKTIAASEIISMIDAGQDVSLSNTTIEGDLDFTKIKDRKAEKMEVNHDTYRYYVRTNLDFQNCTFTGKVLGYFKEDNGRSNWGNNGPLHNADFLGDVNFVNAEFQDDVNFKYSNFEGKVNFGDAEFREEARFKYTKFEQAVNFSGSEMQDYTEFKYTKFKESVSFEKVEFKDEAIFKYTQFPAGVNFSGATFERVADFKYAKFSSPTETNSADFGRKANFAHATLDGRKFSLK